MSKKCKCNTISPGNINLYILLIPLGALFSTAENIISNLFEKLCKKRSTSNNYLYNICIGLMFIFYSFYYI